MPRGSKAAYTDKQKRQAEHIEEGYEDRGIGKDEAESRAWATVNAMTGGGKKSGSGRGKTLNTAPARKGGRLGGKAAAGKKPAARKSSAMKTPVKKTPAKKTPAKKTQARKKSPAKKIALVMKKAPATKRMAEKISETIDSVRKTVEQSAAKITSVLKPAVKKAAARKPAANKTTTRKSAAKITPTRKTAAKPAPPKVATKKSATRTTKASSK